jgi:hypothetical protein
LLLLRAGRLGSTLLCCKVAVGHCSNDRADAGVHCYSIQFSTRVTQGACAPQIWVLLVIILVSIDQLVN